MPSPACFVVGRGRSDRDEGLAGGGPSKRTAACWRSSPAWPPRAVRRTHPRALSGQRGPPPQAEPLKYGQRVEACHPARGGVDRPVAVAPGQGLGGGRRPGLLGGRPEEGRAAARTSAVRSARAGGPIDRGGGSRGRGSATGPRAARARARPARNGWFRAKRACCGTVVSVRVGMCKSGFAKSKTGGPPRGTGGRPARRASAGRWSRPGEQLGGRPARAEVEFARGHQQAVAQPPRSPSAGGSSARGGDSRGRPGGPARASRGRSGGPRPADRRPRAGSSGGAPWCSSPTRPGDSPASRAIRGGWGPRRGARSRWGSGRGPRPKWCIQTRLTQTRAVSGFAGSTIARASSSRPDPRANGLRSGPAMAVRKCRGDLFARVGRVPPPENPGLAPLGAVDQDHANRAGPPGSGSASGRPRFWSFHSLSMTVAVSKNNSLLTIPSSGTTQGEPGPWRTWRIASGSGSGRGASRGRTRCARDSTSAKSLP